MIKTGRKTGPSRTVQTINLGLWKGFWFRKKLARRVADINQFYRLHHSSQPNIRKLFKKVKKEYIAKSYTARQPNAAPETQRRIPDHAYDFSRRMIYYTVQDTDSMDDLLVCLTHEYLHAISHIGDRFGVVNPKYIRERRLNEGVTEYLTLYYWENAEGRTDLRVRSPHRLEIAIVDMLINRWGIDFHDIADAYFYANYGKFLKMVDGSLGEGAERMISSGLDGLTVLSGLSDVFLAILTAKYGAREANKRHGLLHENWGSYSTEQRQRVLRDTNNIEEEEMPTEIYYP